MQVSGLQSWRAGRTLPVFPAADAFLSSGAALPRSTVAPGLSLPLQLFTWGRPLVQKPRVLRGLDSTPPLSSCESLESGDGSRGEEEWERKKVRMSRENEQALEKIIHCSLILRRQGLRQRPRKPPLFLWPKWDARNWTHFFGFMWEVLALSAKVQL